MGHQALQYILILNMHLKIKLHLYILFVVFKIFRNYQKTISDFWQNRLSVLSVLLLILLPRQNVFKHSLSTPQKWICMWIKVVHCEHSQCEKCYLYYFFILSFFSATPDKRKGVTLTPQQLPNQKVFTLTENEWCARRFPPFLLQCSRKLSYLNKNGYK